MGLLEAATINILSRSQGFRKTGDRIVNFCNTL
jgi:hypothetical protein